MAPANGPYTSGTTISSVAINARFADEEVELGDSLSRSGKGGMLSSLRTPDGTVAAPAVSFTSEPGSGLYKAGAGDVRVAVGGVDALRLISGALSGPNATGPITLSGGTTGIQVTLANGFLLLQGNLDATNATNADTVLASTAARTAGYMVAVQNPVGTNKLFIDYRGLLRLEPTSAAAAIQPTSVVTAITPTGGWGAASAGFGYWKDANGMVHLRGSAVWQTGATAVTTLPVGFRTASLRYFAAYNPSNGLLFAVELLTNGEVWAAFNSSNVLNGHALPFDGVSFLAES